MCGRAQFTGVIPTSVGLMTKLVVFQFDSGDVLTGSLPSEMGLATNLAHLAIGYNQLTGTLPSELGYCSSPM